MTPPPRIVLASSSPRRRQLLAEAGYAFDVVTPADHAETAARPGETPAELVARLAHEKAADVVPRVEPCLVVACDTVAECRGEILGKPRDEADARRMLQSLSNCEHHVYSGLCLWPVPGGTPRIEVERTTLFMEPLSAERIDAYLATGLWQGKAGAFGLQDGFDEIHIVAGSESNVVGLPMELFQHMLVQTVNAGIRSESD